MKFGAIVLQANVHQFTESDFYVTSCYQDRSHDVRPPLASAACVGCLSSECLQFLIRTTFILVLFTALNVILITSVLCWCVWGMGNHIALSKCYFCMRAVGEFQVKALGTL